MPSHLRRPYNWRKKRIHFHDFMLNVHSRLQVCMLSKQKGVSDPLEVVAGELSDEAILLCLDEFMILVSTSNRAPDKLYEGGLQRDLFLPFIALLKERCVVHQIGSSVDYRKLTSAEQGFYFVGRHLSILLKQKFQQLIGEHKPVPQEVPLGANGCAYFPFEELCDRPLGAADYFGLFKRFHTLALEGVPIFGLSNRTAAYRLTEMNSKEYLEQHAEMLAEKKAATA
ncbi:hypothetical protein ACJIZ3_000684 [Penstemon smallii]|uniref:Uncharacterized protein n=1 Tax=Penstemon smallii TaxID=265156 RepID=A0ABD3RG76_9LAMI